MHSDLEQAERDEVMNLFRAQKIDVLVATDIVARGIDIDDITMVVNFDAPHDAEDYVHRIGRTARAGREGCAITLIGEKDVRALSIIERTLKIKIPRAKLPDGVKPLQINGIEHSVHNKKYSKKKSDAYKQHSKVHQPKQYRTNKSGSKKQ